MEHVSVEAPQEIKVENLNIKTEYVEEHLLDDVSDTQFTAVIFGSANYTQMSDEVIKTANIFIQDVKTLSTQNDMLEILGTHGQDTAVTLNGRNQNTVGRLDIDSYLTCNTQKDTVVTSDTHDTAVTDNKKFLTVQKNDFFTEDVIIKNEYINNVNKKEILQYNFHHEIIIKNEIDEPEPILMDTELLENISNDENNIPQKKSKSKTEKKKVKKSIPKISFEDEILIENEKRKVFKKKTELKTKRNFICNDCGCNFNHLGNLKRHILRLHTPKNEIKTHTHSCPKCSYTCIKKITLENHINTHKHKPFLCEKCDYKTRHKNNLNRHMLTHTGEKKYVCEICHRKCTTKRGLQFHIMIHAGKKPFFCDKCDFKAVNKHDVKRHARIHGKEKKFSCDVCGYLCIRKQHLILHMRKHLN